MGYRHLQRSSETVFVFLSYTKRHVGVLFKNSLTFKHIKMNGSDILLVSYAKCKSYDQLVKSFEKSTKTFVPIKMFCGTGA